VATNFYFQPFPQDQITNEQLLVEDLVIEALGIYGMDVYYLPRTSRNPDGIDQLYGEDTLKQYVSAHPIEVYLENITGMDGEGDFISKFGLEIRDEITVLVSRRRFKYAVGSTNYNRPRIGDIVATENQAPTRPREGDLIYLPLLKGFFEITMVEHEDDQAMFYTLGRGRGGNVYVYAIKLKKFVFSDEIISTGKQELDDIAFDYYKKTRLSVPVSGTGTFVKGEIVYQGTDLANSTAQAIVHTWNPARHVDVVQVIGSFISGQSLKGDTSNAIWTMDESANDLITTDNPFEDIQDNFVIESEADSIIDFTESNPFGEP
jgi:hypothetical protein